MAAGLFATALLVRLLFWQATPDRVWPYGAGYKGDALVWLEYAQAIHEGEAFELGLPIHPPGAGYLVAALWNGGSAGFAWLRLCWVVMGALVVLLVYLAALRSFGFTVASLAGFLCACSTALLLLGSSIGNEVPYLVLVLATFVLMPDVHAASRPWRLAAWSALHGVACLVRVEHALFYGLLLVLLGARWWRRRPPHATRASIALRVAGSIACWALPLVPWHLAAWQAIARFNTSPPITQRAEEAAVSGVEAALAGKPWRADAGRARNELPAFARRTAAAFVAATVAHRGGREVRGEDFRILDEAFGYVPRPLARFPFVSSYGPLSFYLANHHGASGGFDRSPLEQPPPLAGGAGAYPSFLVRGLPPPNLTLVYPPHLRLFNDGYRLGWQEVRERPGPWLALAFHKLHIFWSGAALGLTGLDMPLGLSGLRRAVDLVVPVGTAAALWRGLVLLACALGVAAGRREEALRPWLLFLASKVVVTVAFFGYARQGATVVPVVALLVALAARRWLVPLAPRLSSRQARLLWALALALPVAVEAARWAARPTLTIDGRRAGRTDPFPADDHRDRRLRVEWRR